MVHLQGSVFTAESLELPAMIDKIRSNPQSSSQVNTPETGEQAHRIHEDNATSGSFK